jgi:hypothetical protein
MPATALEQMILELINRARLDPAAEAARYGIALNEGVAAGDTISTNSKQPLAMNETLLGTARTHSQDMIDRDYFAHDTPEGLDPFERMTNASYNFTTAGENIADLTSTNPITDQDSILLHQFLFVDTNFPGRGHRVNILNGNFQEIGVGQVYGDFQGSNASMLTEDFGTRGNQQFLTGVSYADTNHDNFYSIGEGRGSMLASVVAPGNPSTSTGTAGGYSLAVSSGVQTVTFSGGGLTSQISVAVSIAANTNAKVDVIDQGTIATSASLTDLGGATKIIGLGTFGLALTGDSGNDTFVGTKGNDTIDGAGGSDTVVFSGNASAYTRTTLGNGSIQVAGQDGTDTLSNVEFLQFADQTVAVGAAAGSVVINDLTLTEGNSGTKVATFTVTRSGGTAAFDVNFATADGSAAVADGDYAASAGTLHFGAGVNTQTISVTINGDTRFESNETFSVNLTATSNGATISDSQGIGIIANDDAHRAFRDFNGDDKSDILWRNDSGAIATWDMNDTHLLSATVIGQAASDWKNAGIGDFNGDNKSDILWRNDSGAIATWDMNDTQLLSATVIGQATSDWKIAGTGDFNGDHKSDILWRNDNGSVATWNMNDTQLLSANVVGQATSDWKIAGTGDFNGDGKSDILWRNDSGAIATWDMNDTQLLSATVIGQATSDWHIV